ncbi:MAG: heat-inducible transcriptional repressor HrcA [Ancrocorticia sp.]|jgi:heat-inducible transcriptional repressor|nr:heat-inducible transcriptional repressor HrcA [Ancrocorticia sp.]MCI2193556.1 heat-inducible transcriptional repressor HrcA [Ancrocorticia sp.]MCI2198512.1 heat-inducible transcriptional repressor HrcA [Ancrocorticia sp.]
MGSQERRSKVLEAIVRDYVSTREPVGSKALAERHELGVSPATIRNDMAVLEEAGYIQQPHTSAGRIPTDSGYRSFVDSLHEIKPLSAPERRAIERLLSGAVDLDDVVQRAVRLLASITHQVAVVQYPSLQRVSLRHIELIRAGDTHVLLVIITEAGRVEQRMVTTSKAIDQDALDGVAHAINEECAGKPLKDLTGVAVTIDEALSPSLRAIADRIVDEVLHVLQADSEERIVMAGTANLSRHAVDFARSISPVLEALEEQVILLRLLTRTQEGLNVSIGQENQHESLQEATVVSSTYDVGVRSVARVGVVGPTRMDYPNTMAAVYAVAEYLSDILTGR